MLSPHVLLTRLVAPRLARRTMARARALARFALAEQGSSRTMTWAAAAATDPARRAAYLRHAIDEARHARMFARRAAELGAPPPDLERADAEDLYAHLGETRFLAFVHRAEARGLAEFTRYAGALEAAGDTKTAALFRTILAEEREHARYARTLLVEDLGGASPRRTLAGIAVWEAGRAFRRSGRTLARGVHLAAMHLVYFTFVPLCAAWLARRGPRHRSAPEAAARLPPRAAAGPMTTP